MNKKAEPNPAIGSLLGQRPKSMKYKLLRVILLSAGPCSVDADLGQAWQLSKMCVHEAGSADQVNMVGGALKLMREGHPREHNTYITSKGV